MNDDIVVRKINLQKIKMYSVLVINENSSLVSLILAMREFVY